MYNSLLPDGLQHARLPCPSLTPRACSNSCVLSQWCHLTISPTAAPFSFLKLDRGNVPEYVCIPRAKSNLQGSWLSRQIATPSGVYSHITSSRKSSIPGQTRYLLSIFPLIFLHPQYQSYIWLCSWWSFICQPPPHTSGLQGLWR